MMKRYRLFILLVVVLSSFLGSCDEQDVIRYENDPRIYFYKGIVYDNVARTSYTQSDSVKRSFFVLPDTQMWDTVWVDIRTMGFPTDYERPMKIVQTNVGEPFAAVEGKHYIGFDDERVKEQVSIAAGQVKRMLPVIFYRDPSLEKDSVRLEIEIQSNEYFSVGMDTLSHFMVEMTAKPSKPRLWNSVFSYIFGDWGAKKMWFIMRYVGFTDFENRISDYAYQTYLRGRAAEALAEYNADERNEDRPLREADGTLVEFLDK